MLVEFQFCGELTPVWGQPDGSPSLYVLIGRGSANGLHVIGFLFSTNLFGKKKLNKTPHISSLCPKLSQVARSKRQ